MPFNAAIEIKDLEQEFLLSKHNLEVNSLDLHETIKILESVLAKIKFLSNANLFINLNDSSSMLDTFLLDTLTEKNQNNNSNINSSGFFDFERFDHNNQLNQSIIPDIHRIATGSIIDITPAYFVNMSVLNQGTQKTGSETNHQL